MRAIGFVLPPLMLLAALAGGVFALRNPVHVFGWIVAALFAVVVGWVFVSVLWPGRADRTCPACKREKLERADSDSTTGLACAACGWRDETASSFYLAEEEGPFEHVVLSQREARRGRRTIHIGSPD